MARGVAQKYVKHLLAQWVLKINEHVQASAQEREVEREEDCDWKISNYSGRLCACCYK